MLGSDPSASSARDAVPQCPICEGVTFRTHNGRVDACCAGCGSLERTRFMWLVLSRIGLLKPGIRILHVAPELALARRLSALTDEYLCGDLQPEQYRHFPVPVRRLDLSAVARELEGSTFDLVIHNHVLEHVCADVAQTLRQLHGMIRRGGCQVFSVPFRGNETIEDLSPELTDDERRTRFGQSDHVRVFGRLDFPALLKAEFGSRCVNWDWSAIFAAKDLERAAIPGAALRQLTGETVFRCRKSD